MRPQPSSNTSRVAWNLLADSAPRRVTTFCHFHGHRFCGTCPECQRSLQGRWRAQLEEAKRIAENL